VCRPQLCRHGVTAGLAAKWTPSRPAGRYCPTYVDKSNVTAAVRRQRDFAARPPSIGEQQLGLATSSSAHRLVRLIAVAQFVDQTRGLRL
jgi:hypothetical protein